MDWFCVTRVLWNISVSPFNGAKIDGFCAGRVHWNVLVLPFDVAMIHLFILDMCIVNIAQMCAAHAACTLKVEPRPKRSEID